MSDTTGRTDGGKLRAPRTPTEMAALGLAFTVCLGASYAISLVLGGVEAIPEHLSGYLNGLPLGAVPVLNSSFHSLITRRGAGSGSGGGRTDLPPWFVTGIAGGAILLAWNWFVSFVVQIAFQIGIDRSAILETGTNREALGQAVQLSSSIIMVVMTLLMAVVIGRYLNRYTRSAVAGALVLTGVSFMAFQFGLSALVNPAQLAALFAPSNGPAGIAGAVAGFGAIVVAVIVAGLIGMVASRLNRDRTRSVPLAEAA